VRDEGGAATRQLPKERAYFSEAALVIAIMQKTNGDYARIIRT
jgi:hypothetical protein